MKKTFVKHTQFQDETKPASVTSEIYEFNMSTFKMVQLHSLFLFLKVLNKVIDITGTNDMTVWVGSLCILTCV